MRAKSALVLSGFLFTQISVGTPQLIDRTLSVDSGYLVSLTSDRAFWNFGIEFEYLGSAAFDWVGQVPFVGDNILGRALWGGGFYLLWRYPQYSFFVANHEHGHGSRIVAIGGPVEYAWDDGSAPVGNIFSFFAQGMTRYNTGAYAASGGFTTSANIPDWDLVIVANGVNNSASYAEALEEEVKTQGGHFMQYIGYVRAKEDAADYIRVTQAGGTSSTGAEGDMAVVADYYAFLGYSISLDDIKQGSLVSRWASATNWSYLYGAMRYVIDGDPTVRPFFVGAVKVPDVSHFLTRKGLSYKLRSGLRMGETMFPFAIEYVYKGDAAVELTLGYQKLFQATALRKGFYGIDGVLNANGSFGVIAHGDVPVGSTMLASLGASFFESGGLLAERRLAKALGDGKFGYEVWGRFSILY